MIYPRHNSNLPRRVVAHIQGGPLAPNINGIVWFRDVCGIGTLPISPMAIMRGIFQSYFPIMDMPICAFIQINLDLGM